VEQKTAEELVSGKGHFPLLVAAGVVSPPEGHLPVLECNQPMIRDCNPVGVASKILQRIFRASEGLLRINNPLLTPELAQERAKALRFTKTV
jgi:hypothetical protein